MSFARGDAELVRLLYQFMYLRSGQMAKLAERSNQSIRRRMRELVRLAFVVAIERAPMEEQCYCVGPQGYRMIADELKIDLKDIPFSRQASRADSLFWRHTLLVNNTHIALYMAAENHPELILHETIQEFQLADPRAKAKHKKFLLCERLTDGDKTRDFRPDCMFKVFGDAGGIGNSIALFLEADRGSENLRRIEDKYEAYRLYYERGLYLKNFDVKGMRCLFVLEGVKGKGRIISMRRRLEILSQKYESDFAKIFRFTHRDLLNENSIIDSPIWADVTGKLQPLYKPKGLDLEMLYEEHKDLLVPFYGELAMDASTAQA